jgi:hypothetical protein
VALLAPSKRRDELTSHAAIEPQSIVVIWLRNHLFGRSTCKTRRSIGLSLEEVALLSGMQVSEWPAVEAGYAPQEVNRLRAVADAMEISFDKIATLVLVCRDAWKL